MRDFQKAAPLGGLLFLGLVATVANPQETYRACAIRARIGSDSCNETTGDARD
jgi:hypothetical protein